MISIASANSDFGYVTLCDTTAAMVLCTFLPLKYHFCSLITIIPCINLSLEFETNETSIRFRRSELKFSSTFHTKRSSLQGRMCLEMEVVFLYTSRSRTLWRPPRGSSRDPQTPINDRLSCFGQRYGCFCSH